MTLLQERERRRRSRCERQRRLALAVLRSALRELMPGAKVIVFGSVIRAGAFSDSSDIDVALFEEPPGMTIFSLTSELAERLHRPVDVLLLAECRFQEKIRREGELWML